MSELITEDWKLKARTVVKLYRTRSVSLRKENLYSERYSALRHYYK